MVTSKSNLHDDISEAKNASGLHVCDRCTETGGPSAKKKSSDPPVKPAAVICYVCGR